MNGEYSLLQKIKIRLGQYSIVNNETVFEYPDENPKLQMLISNARESIINVRHYPADWNADKIDADLKQFENVLINLVIYDYNKEGMDFENSHTESGVSRQFQSRARVMADVVPFVHIFS